MKKFVTLVLALVMALAIALPAMAFTSDATAPSSASPYELDIYLVEYADNDFFGITTLPPSDRGYAKNEVVAAVVELYVPKNSTLNPKYTSLELSGSSVNFNVVDNKSGVLQAAGLSNPTDPWGTISGTGTIKSITRTGPVSDFNTTTSSATYKWLVFAKVTGDDASLTVKLNEGNAVTFGSDFTFDGVIYNITKGTNTYTITVKSGDYTNAVINVMVDKNNKSTGMSIQPAGYSPAMGLASTNPIGVMTNSSLVYSGTDYNKVMDVYEDVVKDVFGLDFTLIGNYVRDAYFTDLVSGDTVKATVEIKPWTAYVTVPDNIIVDPPKTGDAASIVGFVMIVLAAAAVVAVKKVRA